MKNVTLKVEGMSCGHCVNSVEDALKNLGVSGKVDLTAKTVAVEFDDSNVSLDVIRAAIEEQGYDVI